MVAKVRGRLEPQYKDVSGYFAIHLGKVTWWFLRFFLSGKRKSLITRLRPEEAVALAPGFEVEAVPESMGSSRVFIGSVDDLERLEPLVLRCYEQEAARH